MPIHSAWRTLIRKTSLSSDRSDGVRSSSRQKTPIATVGRDRSSEFAHRRDFRQRRCSERSYLFTMSDISQISRVRSKPRGLLTGAELVFTDKRSSIAARIKYSA
jgi:hypothetical protein